MSKITVLVGIMHDTALLPFFLQHYAVNLKADQIIGLVFNQKTPVFEHMEMPCRVHFHQATVAPLMLNARVESDMLNELRKKYVRAHGWYCAPDLDEFHLYGYGTFRDVLAVAEAGGFKALHGRVIDRVSIDGRLVEPKKTLDATFPVACDLTASIGACCEKIVMATGEQPIQPGRHDTPIRFEQPERFWANAAEVHHFKWRPHCVPVMRDKSIRYKAQGLGWAGESDKLLALCEHGINLENPAINARPAKRIGV